MLVLHTPVSAAQPDLHLSTDPTAIAGPMVVAALQRAQAQRGRCLLVIGGGEAMDPLLGWLRGHVPSALYRSLQVIVSDEPAHRFEAPDPGRWQELPTDSTLRQLMDRWLAHVPLDPRRILPLSLGGSAEQECLRAGRQLQQWLREPADVALVAAGQQGSLLGMTAGHAGLDVEDVCLVQHGEPARISVTPAVLRRSRHLFVLATGEAVAAPLAELWHGQQGPALAHLLPHPACYVIADPAAASRLWPQPPLPIRADA
jgi:6-phosphogluconolactonase/glucosamine-6-phosphate isomerase/deaminase